MRREAFEPTMHKTAALLDRASSPHMRCMYAAHRFRQGRVAYTVSSFERKGDAGDDP